MRLLEGLLERLAQDTQSVWRAGRLGGPEHLGWGPDTYLLAAIKDELATANKGKKLKSSELTPRPKTVDRKTFRPGSVKDLDWGAVLGSVRGS